MTLLLTFMAPPSEYMCRLRAKPVLEFAIVNQLRKHQGCPIGLTEFRTS